MPETKLVSPGAVGPITPPACRKAVMFVINLPFAIYSAAVKGEANMIRYALALVFSLALSATAFAQERMGPIPAEKMTDSQKKAAADHTAARGSLTGPW